MLKYVAYAVLGLAVTGVSAKAGVVIPNYSFEAPVTTTYVYNPAGASWNFAGSSGVQSNSSDFGYTSAPDGVNTAFFQANNGAAGVISQSITGFTAGQGYQISFYLAARPNYALAPIDVNFGGVDLGVYTPTSSTGFTLFTTNSFVAGGTTGTLTFSAANTGGAAELDAALDNVSISAVPEPISLALLGTGVVGMFAMRRRSSSAV